MAKGAFCRYFLEAVCFFFGAGSLIDEQSGIGIAKGDMES